LVHFIGAAPESANWMAMLRRLLGEFQRKFEIQIEIPDQPDACARPLPTRCTWWRRGGGWCWRSTRSTRLKTATGAPDLVWLPPVIPANVRLVISTLPGRPWEELKKRGWPVLSVEPLTTPERGETD